jgi:hypothetical protein
VPTLAYELRPFTLGVTATIPAPLIDGRQVAHVHFVGTLTNTSTRKSIPDEGNQVVTNDLVTGTTTVDGRVRVDTISGEGVILA